MESIDDGGFELWLEFEHRQDDRSEPEDDIYNMQVSFDDGRKYALNVWTYKAVERIKALCEDSGECLNGAYLLPPDLLVKRLERALIVKVVEDLISCGEWKSEWAVHN